MACSRPDLSLAAGGVYQVRRDLRIRFSLLGPDGAVLTCWDGDRDQEWYQWVSVGQTVELRQGLVGPRLTLVCCHLGAILAVVVAPERWRPESP